MSAWCRPRLPEAAGEAGRVTAGGAGVAGPVPAAQLAGSAPPGPALPHPDMPAARKREERQKMPRRRAATRQGRRDLPRRAGTHRAQHMVQGIGWVGGRSGPGRVLERPTQVPRGLSEADGGAGAGSRGAAYSCQHCRLQCRGNSAPDWQPRPGAQGRGRLSSSQ
jgi:hypothetical protein